MAVITDTELKEQIKSGALDRVYFLYGTEQYIKRKYLYALIEAATDGQPNSFSYAVFEQKNFSADTLHDFISILPFGTDRKCAVISDVDFSCMPQSEADKLAAAINDIPEFCTVLFYCNTAEPVNPPSEKADSKIFDGKKTKQKNRFAEIMKLCERLGCVVKFEAKSDPEIVQFLTRYAAKQGSRMHPTTARYLIENCGNDLQSLINETDKLCMLCMHSEITDKDIDLICPRTLESNVFRITDAISAGNADRAVAVMSDLFAAKVSSDQILGALSASYINIYRGKVWSFSKMSGEEFSRLAGVNPRGLAMFKKNAANYDMPRIRKCLHILEDAAVKFRSTGLSEDKKRIILEEVAVKLIKSAVI